MTRKVWDGERPNALRGLDFEAATEAGDQVFDRHLDLIEQYFGMALRRIVLACVVAATQAIRAMPGLAGLPIVAMTANAFGEDRAAFGFEPRPSGNAPPVIVHVYGANPPDTSNW